MSEGHAQIVKRTSLIHNAASTDFSSSYDYCLVFKNDENNQPSKMAKYAMKQMLAAGLDVFPYGSVQLDELLVLIKCPVAVMKKFADTTDYRMELVPEVVKERLEAGYVQDGVYKIKPVTINDDPMFSPLSPYNYLFARYENDVNQAIYADFENETTRSSQYLSVDDPPFSKFTRLKLINYMLRAPIRQGGCGLKLTRMLYKKKVLAYFPLHDRSVTSQIRDAIMKWDCFPWSFPIDDFKLYFGEKITLYQVFLGHYSKWLIIPALIGLAFQMVVWVTGDFSSPVLPFYSLVITVWCIFMLEYWKRNERMVAMKWGMIDYETNEPDRPEFYGESIKSYIDGGDMTYFPTSEFLQRLCTSQSIITTFILLVIGVVASIYVLRFSLQSDIGSNASLVASILNTIQITIFNFVYQRVAIILTNAENHRTDTQFEDSMIVKLFMFQFINSYGSFFFLAFIASNLDRPEDVSDDYAGQCGYKNCMQPLSINLAIIFGTRLVLKNVTDLLIPYYTAKNKRKSELKGTAEDVLLTPPEEDYVLLNYNSMIEGISNYADTAIQYGFAVLFITALPIASLLSLISNYVRSKAVGWKLTVLYQRPIPQGVEDIGTWQTIFQLVSLAAVITNAGLVCFTMDVLDYGIYGKSWVFIGFQWTLISVQYLVQQIIPDEPEECVIQAQRANFILSKVVDKLEDEDQVPVADYEQWLRDKHSNEDDDEKKGELPTFKINAYPRPGTGSLTANPMI